MASTFKTAVDSYAEVLMVRQILMHFVVSCSFAIFVSHVRGTKTRKIVSENRTGNDL